MRILTALGVFIVVVTACIIGIVYICAELYNALLEDSDNDM